VRKARKKGVWTGISNAISPVGTTIVATTIADTASLDDAGATGDATLMATRLSMSFTALTATCDAALYLMDFQTDATETVPGALIISPLSTDVDFTQKRLLWMWRGTLQTGHTVYVNDLVKARRKMQGNRALIMVAVADTATGFRWSFYMRSYFRY